MIEREIGRLRNKKADGRSQIEKCRKSRIAKETDKQIKRVKYR